MKATIVSLILCGVSIYQTLLAECLKSESRKKKVYYQTLNSLIVRNVQLVIANEATELRSEVASAADL